MPSSTPPSAPSTPDLSSEDHIGHRDLTRWPTAVGRLLVDRAVALARFAGADAVLLVSLLIGAAAVLTMTAASAELYEAVEDGEGLARLDRPILDQAIALRTATNVRSVTLFTHLGGPLWMTIIAGSIMIALALVWRSRTPVVLMVVGVAGSLAATTVGKALVGRVRPPLTDAVPPFESSPSFPSGHTLNSTVIAGLIAYLVLRRIGSSWGRIAVVVLASGWALSMGLSRVFLGHHWMTDVFVGWTLGLAWVAVVVTAHRLYLTTSRRSTS
jgi:undecaprenyl-diphosphatase